ncbi:MAG: hypothetical protein AAGG48_30860 [Planctomycetota bacterium]
MNRHGAMPGRVGRWALGNRESTGTEPNDLPMLSTIMRAPSTDFHPIQRGNGRPAYARIRWTS